MGSDQSMPSRQAPATESASRPAFARSISAETGPMQDIPGSDGMGDVPYTISGDASDIYPLMAPLLFDQKPVAIIAADPSSGDTGTVIEFDGSGSADPDTGCDDRI